MAAGRINKGDLLDPQEIKNLEALNIVVEKCFGNFKKLKTNIASFRKEVGNVNEMSKLIAMNKEFNSTMISANKEQQKLTFLQKEKINKEKQLEKIYAQKTLSHSKVNKQLQEEKIKQQEANKATKDAIKIKKAESGSIEKLSLSLKKNKAQYIAMSKAQRENTTKGKQLTATIKQQQNELNKLNKPLRSGRGLIKSFGKGLMSLAASFGVFLGLRSVIRVFKNMTGISTQFNAKMSEVKAITSASGIEMEMLRKKAEMLGASTQKTATEVGQLEVEFAKLGYSTKQIIEATEATLQLSIATGSDLAQSAIVAASTVKGFGLRAKDTQKVVNVMAKSFSSSALDMQKFQVSMANAQVAAKATGKSLEITTAMLSAIVDTGTDASKAGTDLRVIFGKLAKQGISLDDAYEKINKSENKVVTAMGLVGDRAYSSLITLSEHKDGIIELTKSYENSSGAAKRMADTMEDNLKGDATKAKSALEAMSISLGNKLEPALRTATQAFTRMISPKISEGMREEQIELKVLESRITDTNIKQEDRVKLIKELQIKYPDYLSNINAEKITNKELSTAISNVNIELLKKIQIQIALEEVEKRGRKAGRAQNKVFKEERNMEEYLLKLKQEHQLNTILTNKSLSEKIIATEKSINQRIEEIKDGRSYLALTQEEGAEINNLTIIKGNLYNKTVALIKLNEISTDKQNKLNDETDNYNAILEELEVNLDEIVTKDEGTIIENIIGDEQTLGLIEGINKEISKNNELINKTQSASEVLELEKTNKELQNHIILIKEFGDAWKTVLENETIIERTGAIIEKHVNQLTGTLAEIPLNIETSGEKIKSDWQILIESMKDGYADLNDVFAYLMGVSEEDFHKVKESMSIFLGEMTAMFTAMIGAEMDMVNQRINMHDKELNELDNKLKEQQDLQEEGKANDVSIVEDQIKEEEALRQKSVKEREKLINLQSKLDTIQQVSSLITASANILKGFSLLPMPLGNILGIIAITAMFAAYSAMKTKIKAASKEKYAKGIFDYRGEGSETSDDNMVYISDRESIASAESTKNAPHALKGIIEDGLTDEDLGLTKKGWLRNENLINLNMPNIALYKKEYVNTMLSLKEEINKTTKATENLLRYFRNEQTQDFINPVTGDRFKRRGNILTKIV